jgi:hypothetical protein
MKHIFVVAAMVLLPIGVKLTCALNGNIIFATQNKYMGSNVNDNTCRHELAIAIGSNIIQDPGSSVTTKAVVARARPSNTFHDAFQSHSGVYNSNFDQLATDPLDWTGNPYRLIGPIYTSTGEQLNWDEWVFTGTATRAVYNSCNSWLSSRSGHTALASNLKDGLADRIHISCHVPHRFLCTFVMSLPEMIGRMFI